ncbi:MAG: hypothetical protein PHC91_05015 [Eubacteriales bacterium]|nr:hypothetical protein [Eubacteriales bacterium]
MSKEIIKLITSAVTMCITYTVVNHLNQRDDTINTSGQDDSHYIVKVPDALKYVYGSMFIFGIIMFSIFLFFKLRGNPTVTNGHQIIKSL